MEFLDEVDKRVFCIILHPFTSFRAQKNYEQPDYFIFGLTLKLPERSLKKMYVISNILPLMHGESMMSKDEKKLQEPGYFCT